MKQCAPSQRSTPCCSDGVMFTVVFGIPGSVAWLDKRSCTRARVHFCAYVHRCVINARRDSKKENGSISRISSKIFDAYIGVCAHLYVYVYGCAFV